MQKIKESFTYEEYHEIKTQKDIESFGVATRNFHDACIEELEVNEITDEYCWFKARYVKYHIILD